MTTTTIEVTEIEIAHRQAIAFLKGQIVGYAVREGMSYESKQKPSEFYQKGLDSVPGYADRDWVTERHMAHNLLRHERKHTDHDSFSYGVRKQIKELTGFECDDLEEVKYGKAV